MNRIYLDNAATTAVSRPVLEKMLPFYTDVFGNASSVYETGREARKAVEEARRLVAEAINCKPGEVYFTAGGSESDNWAIKGAAFANRAKGNHIITTAIEHHAVLHTCGYLQKQGFDVTYLPVDAFGCVSARQVEEAVRPETILITVMAANNEIGTLEPIAEIGRMAREKKILFHTDAVQAVGSLPVDVDELGVDMLSLSGHKLHGPKGIGALYVRRGTRLQPLLHGGGQERRLRSGTENVPGIVGLGVAMTLACEAMPEVRPRLERLRDRLVAGVLARVPEVTLLGHPTDRLPGNAAFAVRYVEGESDRKSVV